jgi:uncharacterized protein (DUF736 family)
MQNQTSSNSSERPTTQNQWQKHNIGSLWLKEGGKGKYLSGKITVEDSNGVKITQPVILFRNKFKEKDNQPDYIVFKPFFN